MKIKQLFLKNFRSYSSEVSVKFDNLTTFVGPNDIGKTTILEALNAFFNESTVKLDESDFCVVNKTLPIEISVEFTDLPKKVILDSQVETTLAKEYLLTSKNTLKIKKVYNIKHDSNSSSVTTHIYVICNYPSTSECNGLINKKISELKNLIKSSHIECDSLTTSSVMRQSIYNHFNVSNSLIEQQIELSSKEAKDIYVELKKYFPLYTLFKADRCNNDSDVEVQDPMKQAVKQIFQQNDRVKSLCSEIEKIVSNELNYVAKDTMEKLYELDSKIAKSLTPCIPESSQLKWTDVFKSVSINSENEIPLNKRGSGVRRLVLISFFRAQAERIKKSEDSCQSTGIVYAIEEPETAQHIEKQKILVDSLKRLCDDSSIQVILTTHSSFIVKQLNSKNIRLIKTNNKGEREVAIPTRNCLPYLSLNEINYTSFGDASEEYHNELYGFLKEKAEHRKGKSLSQSEFDKWLAQNSTSIKIENSRLRKDKNNQDKTEIVTLQTYIRNIIHHPENTLNKKHTLEQLKLSIDQMRELIEVLKLGTP